MKNKKIAFLTANLGDFDKFIENEEQTVPHDFYRFTDSNFKPRHCSMTPRLQARIPKMTGLQMKPGYDAYIWLDSSCILAREDSIEWLLEQCGDKDMLVFKHPNRNSIKEEADYLKHRISKNCPYIVPRYKNERLNEQMDAIEKDGYVDDHLFASTCIVYKNNERVSNMMKDWWYHTSVYHSIDQLSFPYVIWKNKCTFNVIEESYTKTPYLEYIRNKK